MMIPENSEDRESLFWILVQHRLARTAMSHADRRQRAIDLLGQLPAGRGNEDVGERIRRAGEVAHSGGGNVVYVNFRPLVTILRLAADSGEGAPLPDPDRPLESADGRFRLWVRMVDDRICVTLEALGFASDTFAHCKLGLAAASALSAPGSDQPVLLHPDVLIAQFVLDEDGDAECFIPNTLEIRQALLRPVIGLIDDGD